MNRVDSAGDGAWPPVWSAALVLIVGATAYFAGQPWLFPSLGPTAYLVAAYPGLTTSRPYNCVVGHVVGIGSGFAAVAVFNAWNSPIVPLDNVSLRRLGAAALAIGLTVLLSQLLRAGHPPAAATTLLVALGAFHTAWHAAVIFIGVALLVALNEGMKQARKRIFRVGTPGRS